MPMKMGIHCKPIGHRHSASLDSRIRGNDGGMFFPRKRLRHLLTKTDANLASPSLKLLRVWAHRTHTLKKLHKSYL